VQYKEQGTPTAGLAQIQFSQASRRSKYW